MNSVRGIFLFVTVISYGFIYKKWRQRDGGEKSPGWNGYMETITKSQPYEVSSILYLSIINNLSSDYDTIYTS